MKLNNCRKAILSLSLLMFLGFGPFDWLSLITNYIFSQGDTVVEQTVPQQDAGGGTGAPIAEPATGDIQCPLCPSPRPRPRPIPPAT